MKQKTTEIKIDDNVFYIQRLDPLSAIDLMVEVKDIFAGVADDSVGVLVDLATKYDGNIFDANSSTAIIPILIKAIKRLDKETVRWLINELLFKSKKVSFKFDGKGQAEPLDNDSLNTIFDDELQNIFILCAYVLKVNFGSFFGKLPTLFGDLMAEAKARVNLTGQDTASLS